jgi:hypothetical protein
MRCAQKNARRRVEPEVVVVVSDVMIDQRNAHTGRPLIATFLCFCVLVVVTVTHYFLVSFCCTTSLPDCIEFGNGSNEAYACGECQCSKENHKDSIWNTVH